jgi:hypothetical protein
MTRLRHRPDHFIHRGNRLAFHRIQDGATLGRLDPYSDEPQEWPLHSGRTIEVTAAEVRDITKQVHNLTLPETRFDNTGCRCNCEAWKAEIEARLAALEAASEPEEPARAPESPPPAPVSSPPVVEGVADPRDAELEAARQREAELLARLADYERPFEADATMVPEKLAKLMEEGETVADARRRLWPLLNDELAKLRNEEALIGKTIPRRAEVEYLIGVLARMGEV